VTVLAGLTVVALGIGCAGATEIDGRFEPYRPGAAVSGTFRSVSSDALKGVMTVWAEDYGALHPGVRITVESATSTAAAAALISGDADLAPMARAMTWDEKNAFQNRYGYPPLELRVGVEAVAFFVNKDNPLSCLTLPQIKSVFSGSPATGTWSDLGLAGGWAARPLVLLGRNGDADIARYVDETAFGKQGFGAAVKEEPLSSTIVRAIAADRTAIGYSSAGYSIAGVKPVAVSGDGGCLAPNERNAYARTYPLAHFLYLYANRKPSGDNGISDFLRYALSLDGQQTLVFAGYFPPPFIYAEEDLGRLGSR
jgi:phosphate transport system substrate-binding protein